MASYFYLLSSLPDLRADTEAPITYEEFLRYCEDNVGSTQYELLQKLSLSSTEGPLVEEWSRSYGALMQELNDQRRKKLGRKKEGGTDREYGAVQAAAAAIAAKNPLEAEKILLAYEFELLDSLVGLHAFDDYVLFGYALKLKLLERQSCFEQEKGKAELTALFDEVRQRIYSL